MVGVQVTVLGNSSRYLAPLGAGTSYLVETDDRRTRVVLDCGNGTHLRLAAMLHGARVDALVVSHFHVDNAADLIPVISGGMRAGGPVFLPRGAEWNLDTMLRSFNKDRSFVADARVAVDEVMPGDHRVVGDMVLSFGEAHHGCPGVTVRLEADGRALTYLSDTGPREGLVEMVKDADLVLAHTLLLDRSGPAALCETNLSAGAAGRLARSAGARRLALSHIPFYGDDAESLAEARAAFGGEVLVLREGQTVVV